MLCTSPIALSVLALSRGKLASHYLQELPEAVEQVKGKIMEMLQKAKARSSLEADEKNLLEAVADFRNCIVREIMTPRVNIFAIPVETTIREAALLFAQQGYSRAPVYKDSLDQIVGLLIYKDIMRALLEERSSSPSEALLHQSVERLTKPVIYTSETSQATYLLKELRQQQSHLAIVVDEYGSTEGLVTIEDCIEQIVGEIADEYDEPEQFPITGSEEEGWVLNGRMAIRDIEDRFHLEIPQEGGYDTIGGYAFYCAGEIPTQGLIIYHKQFELEVLEATDRTVEKVRLKKIRS
jgi:CBS domain containing-hemolysin-like protein